MEATLEWLNYAFSSSNGALQECDFENGVIKARGRLIGISEKNTFAVVYFKHVHISVDVDVVVRFKENRMKVEVIVRHYRLLSGDSFMRGENSLISVGNVFPFTNSENQVAYAVAFINCYGNAFDKVDKFIQFMNKNMKHNGGKFVDDDW